ncbi:uncharacterized protein LOC128232518 isoform X1 [Mya arenaria]|uniref:uncharacterized protein LOC128232518 isoform X1 n=1 Tax=Mya arenaria TaxID=6604 RepID=UPI0022E848BD|nr:uncharacterized protein LOC128232518 isoform X1 [Mya arenaria]
MSEDKIDTDKDLGRREQTPLEQKRALRPILKDQYHQDSLFGNSFQSKSFFVVHPEWLSEAVDNTDPEPLQRPPWPWEQPRYRQNVQLPITYKIEESETKSDENETEKDKAGSAPSSPLPYALPIGYTFTHPSIDDAKPFLKHTQFGAPVVDTSNYKLSF